MLAEVNTRTERYFLCAECKHPESGMPIEHLFDAMNEHGNASTTAGPWFCDHCGAGWLINLHRDGRLELALSKERKTKELLELEIPPQKDPIRLYVLSGRHTLTRTHDSDDQHQYYYEEHTCPVNYFRAVLEVYLGDKKDPHGLAKYVRHIRDIAPGESLDEESEPVSKEAAQLLS